VDCRVEIGWCGERDWHVRMGLPSPAKTEAVSYGSPFFGSRWTDTMREARPRNRDEVSPELYDEYREVQGWLHLAKQRGGITVLTLHPAFHFGESGLEALLLRTPQSCGDPRFYWEQAGRLRYDFSMVLGDPDWRRAGAARLGAGFLRPPVARVLGAMASGFSETPLPQSDSALTIEHDHVELSALYTTEENHSLTARVWESTGVEAEAALSGWLVEGKDKTQVDMLDRPFGSPASSARNVFRLPPWEIASYCIPVKD
jgi:alpha-mannosidase